MLTLDTGIYEGRLEIATHADFARLASHAEHRGWYLEVLPSCIYWDKSDARWKTLRDRPEWIPLHGAIREALLRDVLVNAGMLVSPIGLLLIGVFIPRLFLGLLLFALASPMLVMWGVHGFPVRDRYRALGTFLRDACVRDERLYGQYAETGILRLRAVPSAAF